MKHTKLDNQGFYHYSVAVLFVAIFAIAGVAYLVGSHADAPTPSTPPANAKRIALPQGVVQEAVAQNDVLSRSGTTRTYQYTTDHNWSGYVDTGTKGEFISVQGTAVVPTVQCSQQYSRIAVWVGLDGWGSGTKTVEQDGFSVICNHAKPKYSTLFTIAPGKEYTVTSIPISPGNQLFMKVWYNPSNRQYGLQIINQSLKTRNAAKTMYLACAPYDCYNQSAEWIVERPSDFIKNKQIIYPFPKFGAVDFTGAEVGLANTSSLEPFANYPNIAINATDDPHNSNTTLTNVEVPIYVSGSQFELTQIRNGTVDTLP